jgi:quaternary ammonium compound-resistance protein SugE
MLQDACNSPFWTGCNAVVNDCRIQRGEFMAWLYLVMAGICEIGWPVGLKLGWTEEGARPWWIVFAIVAMTASGALLLWAQRVIPMGTAYAVWTGIGAVGAFTVGVLAFGDSASTMRIVSICLIVAGIVGLKLA